MSLMGVPFCLSSFGYPSNSVPNSVPNSSGPKKLRSELDKAFVGGGGGGRALLEGEGGHRGSPRAVAERSQGM